MTPSATPGTQQATGGLANVSLHSNPVSWFDPAVGLVVLQFYDAQGVKTESIPSQKQLDSYRLHDAHTGGGTAGLPVAPSGSAPASGSNSGTASKAVAGATQTEG